MSKSVIHKLILVVAITLTSIFVFQYGKSKDTFYGDAFGYYLYLPSTFIYHNLKTAGETPTQNLNYAATWMFNQIKYMKNEKGYYLNQYTYGVALMELPFFLIAHGFEKLNGGPADGYSDTYNILIKTATLLYAILGLLILFEILSYHFSSLLSLLGTLAIFLCTNLFWFSIFQAGMAHVPLFFLYALLVLLTIKVHQRPRLYLFLSLGFTAGIITLIRPTDIICLLIPLLYNVYNRETIRQKIAFVKEQKVKIVCLSLLFILPIVPQLFYWKAITGSYVCYSYGSQSFNWSDPKIYEGLFGFSNGWIPYSPIMIFSLIGLLCYKTLIKWKWCISILLLVYIYVIYSWYCYNYINGLGSRPMIHLYPLLALSLTAFFRYVSGSRFYIKAAFITVCLFFCVLNFSLSVQKIKGVINSEESNRAFYLQMLFRNTLTADDLIVKDVEEWQPSVEKLTKVGTLVSENFDDSLSVDYIRDTRTGSRYYYHMHDTNYKIVATIRYNRQKFADAKWFRCSGRFMCPNNLDYFRHLLIVDVNDKNKLWRGCKIENNLSVDNDTSAITLTRCMVNKWGRVSYFARVPRDMKEGDDIKLALWTSDNKNIFVDDMYLELYR